jgi:hypothetical protein
MLWRISASSGICAPDGRELTGIRGQRLYIPVTDASHIPLAGEALAALLWAAGHGYALVGKAGQVLLRTLIDASIWEPERLDFAAPPILADGLFRRPAAAQIWGDPAGRFDLRELLVLADGTARAAATKAKANAQGQGLGDAQAGVLDQPKEEIVTAAQRGNRNGGGSVRRARGCGRRY